MSRVYDKWRKPSIPADPHKSMAPELWRNTWAMRGDPWGPLGEGSLRHETTVRGTTGWVGDGSWAKGFAGSGIGDALDLGASSAGWNALAYGGMWGAAYMRGTTNDSAILSKRDGSGHEWHLYSWAGKLEYMDSGGVDKISPFTVIDNRWHLVGFNVTHTSGSAINIDLWVDGQVWSTTGTYAHRSGNRCFVGARAGGYPTLTLYYAGRIAMAAIGMGPAPPDTFRRLHADPFIMWRPRRKVFAMPQVVSGFHPSWARGSNVYLGAGI
jgi:hypothetical protein